MTIKSFLSHISSLLKIKKNVTNKKRITPQTNRKNSPLKKLLRFTRRNKALTPEQQRELFIINEKNLNTLKTIWKNEHL